MDQSSGILGCLGQLNYIKCYSLSISKVYLIWPLLTMALLTPMEIIHDSQMICCEIVDSDKVIEKLQSRNPSKHKLLLLNCIPVPQKLPGAYLF